MRRSVVLADGGIPVAANTALAALVGAAHVGSGVVLPLLLLPLSAMWLLLLLPLTALTVLHWALIHEAIHGHLHPRRAVNDGLGRVLSMLFGSSFPVLRFGHLSHHSLNSRPTERPDLYDPVERSFSRAAGVFYLRLLIGVYLAEFLSGMLCFLPKRAQRPILRRLFYEGAAEAKGMADRAERHLLDSRRLAMVRLDSALALAWLGLCLLFYGSAAWAFGLAVLGRGVVVSFMDNAPHYGGAIDDAGQGHDMRAPRVVTPLILNTNLHGTHHRHPDLPWTELPRAFVADAARIEGSYFLVPWRQLRGPIPQPSRSGPSERLAIGT